MKKLFKFLLTIYFRYVKFAFCYIFFMKKRKKGMINYLNSDIGKMSDNFVFYRILGNDLSPLHNKGQTFRNLEFILKNESDFQNVDKIWILNRIIDVEMKSKIIDLLTEYQKEFIDIPFVENDYLRAAFFYDDLPVSNYTVSKEFCRKGDNYKNIVLNSILRNKNLYVMNNNGARNFALSNGKNKAKWIMPWDGNTFLTEKSFNKILKKIKNNKWCKYVIVPMIRLSSNNQIVYKNHFLKATEEPQVVFRCDTTEIFNNDLPYGRRPKIELLQRLDVPGPWLLNKRIYPWEIRKANKSDDKYFFIFAGNVARLSSDNKEVLVSIKNRAMTRDASIINMIENIDFSFYKNDSPKRCLILHDVDISDTLLLRLFEIDKNLNNIYDNNIINQVRLIINCIKLKEEGSIDYYDNVMFYLKSVVDSQVDLKVDSKYLFFYSFLFDVSILLDKNENIYNTGIMIRNFYNKIKILLENKKVFISDNDFIRLLYDFVLLIIAYYDNDYYKMYRLIIDLGGEVTSMSKKGSFDNENQESSFVYFIIKVVDGLLKETFKFKFLDDDCIINKQITDIKIDNLLLVLLNKIINGEDII